jgi:uncharacterized Fe-S cluster protein YjdI
MKTSISFGILKIVFMLQRGLKILPKVYIPKDKPWLSIENGTTKELKEQISHCPSGAITFIEK